MSQDKNVYFLQRFIEWVLVKILRHGGQSRPPLGSGGAGAVVVGGDGVVVIMPEHSG